MNELGRKTFFWYRVYVAVLALIYLAVAAFGMVLAIMRPATREYSQQEIVLLGAVYAAIGAVFFIAYAIAIFLPPKPYNWIVGIVMMAISMTSCCFVPFALPLIIYWLKPETRSYFGRN
jgi:hypothetical protein